MRTGLSILLLSLLLTAAAPDMPRLVPEAYWGTALIDGNPAHKLLKKMEILTLSG